jgi:S-DNA-T family DNA segregation ATPase FtsK/SpoIIIE
MFARNFVPAKNTYIVIDEFADLMLSDLGRHIKNELMRIIQRSRAMRMYVILSTQRPSAKIIDGAIKANFHTKIALKVDSKLNSRIILDNPGAELLDGNGDALICSAACNMVRFRSFFV